MSKNPPTALSGQQLIADYQSVFINGTAALMAQAEAERSEAMVMNQLSGVANGGYLQPGSLSQDWQAGVTRESIDAHIKKAQASQLNQLSVSQLETMSLEDNTAYHKRKVRITVTDKAAKPLEAIWFNKQTGYHNGVYKRTSITGTINEVLLDKNALVIKPTFVSRTFIPNLQLLVAYIIHPETMQPMVEITLL